MGEYDPDGGIPESIGPGDSPEPVSLLAEVLVHAEHPLILDIIVRLVLTAVEDDEEELAPLECIVRHAGRCLEPFEPVPGEQSAELVVAPDDIQGSLVREQFRGGPDIHGHMGLFVYDRSHVAVEDHEIVFSTGVLE